MRVWLRHGASALNGGAGTAGGVKITIAQRFYGFQRIPQPETNWKLILVMRIGMYVAA